MLTWLPKRSADPVGFPFVNMGGRELTWPHCTRAVETSSANGVQWTLYLQPIFLELSQTLQVHIALLGQDGLLSMEEEKQQVLTAGSRPAAVTGAPCKESFCRCWLFPSQWWNTRRGEATGWRCQQKPSSCLRATQNKAQYTLDLKI